MDRTKLILAVIFAVTGALVLGVVLLIAINSDDSTDTGSGPRMANTIQPDGATPRNVHEAQAATKCTPPSVDALRPLAETDAVDRQPLANKLDIEESELDQVVTGRVSCKEALDLTTINPVSIVAVEVGGFQYNCLVAYPADRSKLTEADKRATRFDVYCTY